MQINEKRLYETIGNKIRELRTERDFSQAELAFSINLERTSITNIETGKQKITIFALYGISKSLGVPLSDLLPEMEDLTERTLKVGNDHEISVGAKTFAALEKLRSNRLEFK